MNRLLTFLIFVLVLIPYSGKSRALAPEVENELRAALLFKMSRYISWVPPVNIINYCFYGERSQSVGKVLANQIKIKNITSMRVSNVNTPNKETTAECDVFYHDSNNQNADFVSTLPESIFSITNDSKDLQQGFIISIEIDKRKPQLTVSKSNLKNKSVTVDSRFLAIVKIID